MINLNKKGDVSLTVLVIGIFLVCVIALFTFTWSDTKFKNRFFGVNTLEEINSDVEQFYTYINLGYSKEISASLIDAEYNADEDRVTITKEVYINKDGKNSERLLKVSRTFKP